MRVVRAWAMRCRSCERCRSVSAAACQLYSGPAGSFFCAWRWWARRASTVRYRGLCPVNTGATAKTAATAVGQPNKRLRRRRRAVATSVFTEVSGTMPARENHWKGPSSSVAGRFWRLLLLHRASRRVRLHSIQGMPCFVLDGVYGTSVFFSSTARRAVVAGRCWSTRKEIKACSKSFHPPRCRVRLVVRLVLLGLGQHVSRVVLPLVGWTGALVRAESTHSAVAGRYIHFIMAVCAELTP